MLQFEKMSRYCIHNVSMDNDNTSNPYKPLKDLPVHITKIKVGKGVAAESSSLFLGLLFVQESCGHEI